MQLVTKEAKIAESKLLVFTLCETQQLSRYLDASFSCMSRQMDIVVVQPLLESEEL